MGGTSDKSWGLGTGGVFTPCEGTAERKQWVWQKGLPLEMAAVVQSMWGLWSHNQGSPRTIREQGEGMTKS